MILLQFKKCSAFWNNPAQLQISLDCLKKLYDPQSNTATFIIQAIQERISSLKTQELTLTLMSPSIATNAAQRKVADVQVKEFSDCYFDLNWKTILDQLKMCDTFWNDPVGLQSSLVYLEGLVRVPQTTVTPLMEGIQQRILTLQAQNLALNIILYSTTIDPAKKEAMKARIEEFSKCHFDATNWQMILVQLKGWNGFWDNTSLIYRIL